MRIKRSIILLASLLLTIALVSYAGVLVIYNVNVESTSTVAPLSLTPGSNAGAADLNGTTISVTIVGNYSATVQIHPTYAPTYYFSVLNITDNVGGDGDYYGQICVTTPLSATNYTRADLYLFDTNTSTYVDLNTADAIAVTPLNLTVAGCSSTITLYDYHDYYFVFVLQVSESTALNTTDTFSLALKYSPNSADLGYTLPP